jgi:hypothetical protein
MQLTIELDEAEQEVFKHLREAKKAWEKLPARQPQDDSLFRMAMVELQGLIALRTIRRNDREDWGLW